MHENDACIAHRQHENDTTDVYKPMVLTRERDEGKKLGLPDGEMLYMLKSTI